MARELGTEATSTVLLKRLCRSLERQRQKSHQEATEWQNFGRYTAAVLQKEVEGFERKLRVLQEKLDGLVQENRELQEMCFYLDKSRGRTADSSVDEAAGEKRKIGGGMTLSTTRAPVHSMCAEEMNKDDGPTLQYTGITSDTTLHDKREKFNIHGTKDIQIGVVMLQKRVEKLESEKLELIKSLSAAHLLVSHHSHNVEPPSKHPPAPVEEPVLSPEFQTLLESCKRDDPEMAASSPSLNVSADMIIHAVTLLDMCRRLDALESTGFTDILEEAEVATLRVLMSIAWQQLQEDSKPK